jgi:hypothetical protein
MAQTPANRWDSALRHLFAFLSLTLLAAGPAAAFSDERPVAPADGENVFSMLEFYIEADGSPEPEEFYKIEVSPDPDFDEIIASFDSRENKRGWVFGDMMGLEDVPEELIPQNYQGVHLRTRLELSDGEYFWRAFKAIGGGSWEPLGRELSFYVDTTPPASVRRIEVRVTPRGELAFNWEPVIFDLEQNQELVAGYRIYRYTSLKKRYPVLTRYLIAETDATEHVVPDAIDDGNRIVFYKVQAVDETGNEEGRRRPAPIGTYEDALEPFDAERAVDPRYFSQQGR